MEESNNGITTDFEGLFPYDENQDNEKGNRWKERKEVPPVEEINEGQVSSISKKKQSSRVAVSLAQNLSMPVINGKELIKYFDNSERGDGWTLPNGETIPFELKRDVLQIFDEKSSIENSDHKPVRLSNQEQKLCYAISLLLSKEKANPQLNFLIHETELGKEDPYYYPFTINGTEVAKVMTGESRTRAKNVVGKLTKNVVSKCHVFRFQTRTNPKDKLRVFTITSPLILQRHITEEEVTDEDGNPIYDKEGNVIKNFIGMKVELFRPFFDNITKKNTPITPTIFRLWKDSNLFSNLFSKLNELWYYSKVGYDSANQTVMNKYGNIKNADKVSEIEEEIHKVQYASITKVRTFDFIMSLAEDDFNSTRKKRYNFKLELEDCIKRFIQYGIITDKSHIVPDKKEVVFVFNMNFGSNIKLID